MAYRIMTTRGGDAIAGVIRVEDGACIPESLSNADWRAYLDWQAGGNTPEPANAAQPTAADVRSEASRRMQVLVGARDIAHLEIIIANGTREAVRLLRKGAAAWTPEEAGRAAELEALDAAIEAIRAASNAMEKDPPVDYADDAHWPKASGATVSGTALMKALALHGVLGTPEMLAAIEAGVLPGAIEAVVDGMAEPLGVATRTALASDIARNGGPLAALCGAFAIDGDDIDALWSVALAIQNGGTT